MAGTENKVNDASEVAQRKLEDILYETGVHEYGRGKEDVGGGLLHGGVNGAVVGTLAAPFVNRLHEGQVSWRGTLKTAAVTAAVGLALGAMTGAYIRVRGTPKEREAIEHARGKWAEEEARRTTAASVKDTTPAR
jgi:hypothetical protein